MGGSPPRSGLWRALLWRTWWTPRRTGLSWLLWPVELVYRALRQLHALPYRLGMRRAWRAPCPVVVVGNLVVGGAGKTPTVIALVAALQAAGRRPGIVSRGYGRRSDSARVVGPDDDAASVGDEPMLMRRRTGVPIAVGARRAEAVSLLLRQHPELDLVVADDGLQHHALARDAEVWLFDERGVGNGALLPAGPLRQPLPARVSERVQVIYNAAMPSTALPGPCVMRRLAGAVELGDWHAGRPPDPLQLEALRGRDLVAVAGIAVPTRFFSMLRAQGLSIRELALPDHSPFDVLPWPDGTAEVVCTEKDAVKLDPRRLHGTRVWVVGLDFGLPEALVCGLLARLPPFTRR